MASGFLVRAAPRPAGWTSYPPARPGRPPVHAGRAQDLWIVGLVLIGTSSILGGINFLVTIFKMRAPGMTLFRMPILVWTVLVTSVLVVMATPVLTSALIMLFIDRNYGGHFFDPATGGNAILYQNVFWFYSHPAVYIMVLPAMGIDQRGPAGLQPQAAVRLQGVRVRDGRDRRPGLLASGPTTCSRPAQVFLPFFSLMTFLRSRTRSLADTRRRSARGSRCRSRARVEKWPP